MSLRRRLLDRVSERFLLRFTLTVLLFALVFAYFAPNIIYTIPAGNIGVRWSRFFGGTVLDRIYREGIHFILPWDKMFIYDARITHEKRTYEALTVDGLHISITFDVRYRLIEDRIPYLHKYVGEDYIDILLAPTVGAYARINVARFTAEQVYSTQRLFIEQVILQQIRTLFHIDVVPDYPRIRFIDYDQVLIHAITLPERVQSAIEGKVEQYHVALEWQYRVEREQLESRRRIIEAQATAQISDMLKDKLSESFLRLRSIDALTQLGTAPGSRTVVLGQGGGILPVVPPAGDGRETPVGSTTPPMPDLLRTPGLPTLPVQPMTAPPTVVPPSESTPQPRRRPMRFRRRHRTMGASA